MHEVGIAIEIYRMCRARMDERGGGRLERVSVAVGELSAVAPDLLVMAWEAVIAGGDSGARLDVEWRPAGLVCPRCGDGRRARDTWSPVCPRCGGPVRVEGGRELDLLELEFSAPATPSSAGS